MESNEASFLKNKRILINQPLIHGINGSTVVSLELAKKLSEFGCLVTVYTLTLQDPAKKLFLDSNISVKTAQDNPQFKLKDFDYIWVNSQVLPISIIDDLEKPHAKYPSFIFHHMSSMSWIPDEHPFIYMLEEKLSSLSLYICEEVRKTNTVFFYKETPHDYFRNPAPMVFKKIRRKPKDSLERLLIVSNYPPKELLEAKDLLRTRGLSVDILGEGGDKYTILTPELLQNYDAVITIAKTVQYCLLANIPVYIYGKFGGAGWLSEKNYKKARQTNFCGSDGFSTKSAEKITEEIITNYSNGRDFQNKHQDDFDNDFLLEKRIKDIFSLVKHKTIEPFDKQYAEMVKASLSFEKIRFEEWSNTWNLTSSINKMRHFPVFRLISIISRIKNHLLSKK